MALSQNSPKATVLPLDAVQEICLTCSFLYFRFLGVSNDILIRFYINGTNPTMKLLLIFLVMIFDIHYLLKSIPLHPRHHILYVLEDNDNQYQI